MSGNAGYGGGMSQRKQIVIALAIIAVALVLALTFAPNTLLSR